MPKKTASMPLKCTIEGIVFKPELDEYLSQLKKDYFCFRGLNEYLFYQ